MTHSALPGTPRLDDPGLYEWQLNENSTRFDYPRAIPDDRTMHIQFSILATINAIVATAVLFLLVSMLRSPKVRSSIFNLYLMGISFPDFVANFLCLLTCAMSAPMSSYFSEVMCGFQAFYLIWSFTSNCWLNTVILYQVHTLLKRKNAGIRHLPPTRKQVYCHCLAVYAYAAVWAFVTSFNLSFLPHQTHLYYGLACFAMEYDRASTMFFWFAFMPGFILIPLGYAAYVCVDIWRRNLLPSIGRRRTLFLLRFVLLYFVIWFPYLALCFVGNLFKLPGWLFWAGAVLSHSQGLVSVLFCTTDPDINEAMRDLLRCGRKPSTMNNLTLPGGGDDNSRVSDGSSSSLLSFLSKGLEDKCWEVNWGPWTSTTMIASSAVEDSQVVEVSQIDLPEEEDDV